MKANKKVFEKNSCKETPESIYIKVVSNGPYLIFGNPPINQEVITQNKDGYSWEYKKGLAFDNSKKSIPLCRCGKSGNKPYCDGEHLHCDWDPKETCPKQPILEEAELYEGPALILADNKKYCALARFCDAYKEIWDLIKEATTEEEKELVRHQAGYCPAGRLVLFDKEQQEVYEPDLEPSISILEDPGARVSGPIWVKGGIRIKSTDGSSYEVRNRVTLCRCGQSKNKPFCDASHVHVKFRDGLLPEEENKNK